jgi:hypothetical protein
MIHVFEVQYNVSDPSYFQSRIITVEDWNTYVNNVINYRRHNNNHHSTVPRNLTLYSFLDLNGYLEFYCITPLKGELRQYKSWIVQIKD